MPSEDNVRPRLVLVTTLLADGESGEAAIARALSGGDVASVIIEAAGRDETAFQDFCQGIVPIIQEAGAAAIVVDDTRCAGRVKADGLHVSGGSLENLGDAMARFSPRLIVGASGFKTRHEALDAGERLPDYLLFGRLGLDDQPGAHERDLAMAEWWAEIVEIPCIVMGGGDLDTLREAAATGVEFVALSSAIFAGADGREAERVAAANAVFDAVLRTEAA